MGEEYSGYVKDQALATMMGDVILGLLTIHAFVFSSIWLHESPQLFSGDLTGAPSGWLRNGWGRSRAAGG